MHCLELTNNVEGTVEPTLPSDEDPEEEPSLKTYDAEAWAHVIPTM